MNASNRKLGYFAGATALVVGLGILGSSSGCEEVKDVCDLDCPDTGVAEGNASISGFVAIDAFFQSVVNFKGVATGVAADIKAELDGIQTAFGVSAADLKAQGNLGAAIKAKFDASFEVDAQPAKCEIDASFSAQANVECQASANCEGTPPSATVECSGSCTVEASAEGKCDAMADVTCEVSGPQLTCMGECSGSCTVDLTVAAKCDGACNGTCDGSHLDRRKLCGHVPGQVRSRRLGRGQLLRKVQRLVQLQACQRHL